MRIYLVGGAVRDQLMGLDPKDKDYVVVGSTPAKMLLAGYEQVGADFPVFLHPETREEYALARIEKKSGDGYHGFAVNFGTTITLEDDLERRDLTINSMALDSITGLVIDPFGGQEDLKNKVLRHTSSAFKDDPLRVIRLARFAARMPDFSINEITWQFAQKLVDARELNHLPGERFAAEIVKVLETCTPAGARRFFELLGDLGVEKRVRFFESVKCSKLAEAAEYSIAHAKGHLRLQMFVALGRGDMYFSQFIGGTEGWLMNQLVTQCRDSVCDAQVPDALLGLFQRIGWQNDGRLCRFVQISEAARNLGTHQAWDRSLLVTAFDQLEPVSTRLGSKLRDQGLNGKQIGEAIKAERTKIARCLLTLT